MLQGTQDGLAPPAGPLSAALGRDTLLTDELLLPHGEQMSQKLSSSMKKALRNLVRSDNLDASTATVRALAKRRLLSENQTLTKAGWAEALLLLPLSEQCHHMKLPIERLINANHDLPPEIAAWENYRREGFVGSYCEGGAILILIRAAALDLLASVNTFNSRIDACERFTEAQLSIHQDKSPAIIQAIESATPTCVARNFDEIYANSFVREFYPSLSPEGIVDLFLALGSKRLAAITKAIMEDPYKYRSGWPDLTIIRNGLILWVEVKTTDKLHMSQIVTLSRMKDLLPGELKVLQLIN